MPVEEKPAQAPFGARSSPDAKVDPKATDPRVGSSSLVMPDTGHFVVVQVSGHKSNTRIEHLVGLFHSLTAADAYAAKDRGLIIHQVEVLDA